ncbi:N-acetyl-alpha-D-glucosaminyl-diphospho-ditrans, octacis-undecaprenol 4-epimerase [Flavobacterium sp. CECT 9288]|uniref:NAD-dependent epimerase/dehydratase family protein n=1 Tax=Flavobacterium sp. CECT 9288 TaxID=2845819 RepID=UPI001E48871A|nr:NAD-dependent epimerase/dehydratase family protein [Flavobacterium sp. CECT 9288]CAH0334866.1 N-acetyl-alpha-D-glucosaminyl-diphospho-ditrans, octacis-undecaprenol 4-epimerase [Flavobacterium sp. CECT 9288]
MKIAITGATGFVGKNLQDYLKTSHEIETMSVRYLSNQQFEIKGDVIIHLAGKAHDLKKVAYPQDYYEANYELTKQLFNAFLISEATVFIFMSTVKAVADEVKGILSEDKIPNPQTHYGIAKHQAEEYILEQKLPQDKRVFIIRPCMIHGPGNKGNLNLLYNIVKKGIPYPLASFQNQRSFLGIDNLNFMIDAILSDKNILSGVYNFADDDAVSTNRLVEIIAEVSGKKAHLLKIPKVLITTGAKIGDKIKLPLNSETVKKLTENYRVSNDKIKKAIGIENLPISASEGLKKTIKSFMK